MENKVLIGMNNEAAKLLRRKILELLERKNMSLLSLSKETGIPSTSLHDILIIGKRIGRGSIGYIEAICEYFNKDLKKLLSIDSKNEEVKLYYTQLEKSPFKKIPKNIQKFKNTCRKISMERSKYHFSCNQK